MRRSRGVLGSGGRVGVARIEQILPTLATKADLERVSTGTNLELSAIRTDVETSERRMRVLVEHLSGSVETRGVHLSDQMHRLSDLVERLDRGR